MNKPKLLTIAVLGLLLINLATLTFIFIRKPHPQPPPPLGNIDGLRVFEILGLN